MAGTFSDYLEKKLQDEVLGGVNFAPPGTVYLALLTDTNTAAQRDAGTLTEVSTGVWTNYQRCPVTNNTTNFPVATGVTAAKTNANDIGPLGFLSSGTTIAASSAVTIQAAAWYDAPSGGNLLIWFDLIAAKVVANGDQFKVAAGSMNGTLD